MEVRNKVEKASIILENKYIVMNRILVEIQMLKVLLVRSQMEIRKMLLDVGGKEIFVVK